MELQVAFQRTSWKAEVVGDRLRPDLAREVAAAFRRRRKEVRSLARIAPPWITQNPERKRSFLKELESTETLQGARIARAGRGQALWIGLRPGRAPRGVPLLQDVAKLEDASGAEWGRLIEHFGLPLLVEKWVVLNKADFQLLRVRLTTLRTIAKLAKVLVATEHVVLHKKKDGELQTALKSLGSALENLGMRRPTPQLSTAQDLIARVLEDAVSAMKPVMSWTGDRGISDAWGLNSSGWWPLMVLDRYVHQSRYVSPEVMCAAPDCSNPVPTKKLRGRWSVNGKGTHYCSNRCRERWKARRRYSRRKESAKGPRDRQRGT